MGDSEIKWSGKKLAENNSLSIFRKFIERLSTKYAQKNIRKIGEIRFCIDRSNNVHSRRSFNVIDENWWTTYIGLFHMDFHLPYTQQAYEIEIENLNTLSYELACLCSQTSA
jgi:hypothetical protein